MSAFVTVEISFGLNGQARFLSGKCPASVVSRVAKAARNHWLLDTASASSPYGRLAAVSFKYCPRTGKIWTGHQDQGWIDATISAWDNRQVSVKL